MGGPDRAGLAQSGRHRRRCPSVGIQRPLGVCGGGGEGGDLVMQGVVKQVGNGGNFPVSHFKSRKETFESKQASPPLSYSHLPFSVLFLLCPLIL